MTEEDALRSASEFRKDDERKLRTEKELAALNLKTRFKTAMGGSKSQFFFFFGSCTEREREGKGFYVWGQDGSVKFDSDFYLFRISLEAREAGGFWRLEMCHDTCNKIQCSPKMS